MKKIRIFNRPDRPGYYIQWRELGRRKTKQVNTKEEAEHFAHLQYCRLNDDVYTSIDLPWSDARQEYLQKYDIDGLSKSSKMEAQNALDMFSDLSGPFATSKQINQRHIEYFVLKRREQKRSDFTIKKNIGQLKAFINWLAKRNYHSGNIDYPNIKTKAKPVKILKTEQIQRLFAKCPTIAWRIRLLLSLTIGLRSGDIDSLKIADFDFARKSVDTSSTKSSKSYTDRPLPNAAIPEIKAYADSLPKGQINLFTDINLRKTWEKIAPDTTRQMLRKTFSTLMQKIGSAGSAQNLLEHSDIRTTQEFYTDQELILRWKVDQLPVKEWLNY